MNRQTTTNRLFLIPHTSSSSFLPFVIEHCHQKDFCRCCRAQVAQMTARQIQLIRETFAQVEHRAAIAGLVFYQRLFALNPSLRALFTHDINEQAVKLMQALKFAVAAVEQPRELQPVLESLGRRHVYYGVEERHYESVGTALLGTLAVLLGPAFTAEVKEAWQAIYTYVADTMKRAAAKVPQEDKRGVAGGTSGSGQA